MISREEAYEMVDSSDQAWWIENVLDKIYDSIGTCQDCKSFGTCPILGAAKNGYKEHNINWYCAGYEPKGD